VVLPALVALFAALGPLLRGAWDLWAQVLLQAAAAAVFFLWLAWRAASGRVLLPPRRLLAWTAALMAFSAASALASPVHGLARPDWYNLWAALWIFPAVSVLTNEQRSRIDEAIRASAWILFALAFYQHFRLGEERPASALINENVYAGAVLMLFPVAIERGAWLLSVCLLWSLWWTRSAGAWLALSATVMLYRRRARGPLFWAGAAAALACAAAFYGKLGAPETLNRWRWWKAAAAMAAARPLLGFGPGAFAYVLPAYSARAEGLNSGYAHQYILQTVADMGIPFALAWFAGLWRCLRASGPYKRFGLIAVLIHSLWDYALSMPANLWLFCYLAACAAPPGAVEADLPPRQRRIWAPAAAILGLALCVHLWTRWQGSRLTALGLEAMQGGRTEEALELALRAGFKVPDDPEPPRLAAIAEMSQAQGAADAAVRARKWLVASHDMERSLRLNPYRASSWAMLAAAYRSLGRPDRADKVLLEAGRYQARSQ